MPEYRKRVIIRLTLPGLLEMIQRTTLGALPEDCQLLSAAYDQTTETLDILATSEEFPRLARQLEAPLYDLEGRPGGIAPAYATPFSR